MSYISEPYEKDIRAAIAAHRPDLAIESLDILTHGTECIAADLNNQFILKFPIPERTVAALKAEYSALHFLQGKVDMPIPNPDFFDGHHPFMIYEKIKGDRFNIANDYLLFCPLTPKERVQGLEYSLKTESEKEHLAEDIATFFAQMHAINVEELADNPDIVFSPACTLSDHNMQKSLQGNSDPMLKNWLSSTIEYYAELKIPEEDKVFGHFDCTSGNMLFNPNTKRLSGVFDFGNVQVDDFHRDLSCMNLTAPLLTKEVLSRYQRMTNRYVNHDLVDFYTSFMHLYCVAELRPRKRTKELQMWQGSMRRWHHLLSKKKLYRAVFPDEWRMWISENMILGTSVDEVVGILQKEGFQKRHIDAEIYYANLHPYVMAARRLLEKEKEMELETQS